MGDKVNETLTASDIEILRQETNHRTFLKNHSYDPYIVSNCCGARVIDERDGQGICADCYEHCGAERIEE